MKNLEKAAKKIKDAENIVLYSDSDLDGITCALIAKKTLEEMDKKPSCFFADRERGYGINVESVELIKDKAPGLLIVMDCGISNFKGVKKAKEEGFEVLILDHHEPHEKLPEADVIVCPKLFDDDFKERPNAGIILELSELLLEEKREEFYEYTALAIFGDMMPHEGVNAEVLFNAKQDFPSTRGVKILSNILKISEPFNFFQEVFPILNVTRIISGTPESFLYFLNEENNYQEILAKKMIKDYEERKRETERIKNELIKDDKGEEIVFAGSNDWPSFILGKIASKLVIELDKPIFIYREKGDLSQGTVRVPKGVDAVEAMKASAKILENYGGHPPAAGFTIKTKDLEKFKNNLIEYFK